MHQHSRQVLPSALNYSSFPMFLKSLSSNAYQRQSLNKNDAYQNFQQIVVNNL